MLTLDFQRLEEDRANHSPRDKEGGYPGPWDKGLCQQGWSDQSPG